MTRHGSHFWKKVPFIKLLIAFAAGILLEWYLQPAERYCWMILSAGLITLLGFFYIPLFRRFKLGLLPGIAVSISFLALGGIITRYHDVRKNPDWIGHNYKTGEPLIVNLDEPLVEKERSHKAVAKINYIIRQGRQVPVQGRIILYFRKDTTAFTDTLPPGLCYGARIIFRKPLQEIKNSGNPGGFDYKRYSLFRGITHQVFLKPGEYEILPGLAEDPLKKIILASRQEILDILRANIPGERELGLAEALLIGYKDDLEQGLVQSYTNTGVVHIIAISGLHLGLIYWLLGLLLKPFGKNRKIRWLRPLFIISGLWAFSFLAGAQPSILRSALMFSLIVLGEGLGRKNSIFNSIALSAFLLLCINPYWLWDVGFQLSYAAVLSIIIFMKPIYNWFYFPNKLLDLAWKLNAVTLAAQILTIPLSVYHFHQFPLLFFVTNFLAVPLSSVILLGEILLCIIAFIPGAALLLGKAISGCIRLMNTWIEKVEQLPASLWDGLQITLTQSVLLFLLTAGISWWLMEKQKKGLVLGILSLLGFTVLRTFSFIQRNNQQKIIVYNVPRQTAVDLIDGRNAVFLGDSILLEEGFLRNFHLKPSHTLHRTGPAGHIAGLKKKGDYILFKGIRVLLIDEPLSFPATKNKERIDLLIITKNPRLYFSKLVTALNIRQVVFDGSAPAWKVNYWKKDCDSLRIPCHDVTLKGAFVMNLN